MAGSTDRALGPRGELSVGTVRQPRSVWPSSATIRSSMARHAARSRGVAAAGRQPRRRSWPGSGSAMPRAAHSRGRNWCGHLDQDARAVAGVVLAAAGAAVVEVVQRLSAWRTIACDLRPLMSTTKPTPQASCSCGRIVEALRRRQTRSHCRHVFVHRFLSPPRPSRPEPLKRSSNHRQTSREPTRDESISQAQSKKTRH